MDKPERGMWRGKSGEEWIIGWRTGRSAIRDNSDNVVCVVDPSTLGEYTGQEDRCGKHAFEHDYFGDFEENIFEIFYSPDDCAFMAQCVKSTGTYKEGEAINFGLFASCEIEIIGPKWDNPTLLGGN